MENTWRKWILGARPKTLPAAIVPVLVGSAVALGYNKFSLIKSLAALIVSLSFQIAVNYANDYSDGIKGTDAFRIGPPRLVGGGFASPKSVKLAAQISIAIACVVGFFLSLAVNPALIVIGVLSIGAAWFYTGGSKPYGYFGMGEIFVFIFFGLIAVVGSTYVQIPNSSSALWISFLASIPVGFLSSALLVTNNFRDLESDRKTQKLTLAVRLGATGTKILYIALIVGSFLFALILGFIKPWVLLSFIALPIVRAPISKIVKSQDPNLLIKALGETARLQIVFGVLLSIGLAIN